jgi:adenine-specific DNA-methyltransferase
MNELKGVQGFFYHNFSPKSNPSRFYFTEENAAKLDAFRVYLEKFKDSNSRIEDYLYYCCLEAMSKVSNTTGVQSAYLKKFKPRALKPIVIEPEPVSSPYLLFCAIAHHKDLLSLLNESEKKRPALYREEILYIDPPYNHRQYGPNYHLYETFVLGGSDTVQGKTGLRDWKSESRSDFCDKKKCLDYLSKVVSATTACLVFVSYNSDGLFTPEEFEKKFSGKWQVSYERWKNRRYRSASSSERKFREDDLYEYLFILERPLTGVALSA